MHMYVIKYKADKGVVVVVVVVPAASVTNLKLLIVRALCPSQPLRQK